MTAATENWIEAGDYTLLLDGDEILARNAKGKQLKTVPAKVKKLPEYEQLDGLSTTLAQHRRACFDDVTGWFLRGDSIPTRLIAAVWADPAWQALFKDAILAHEQGNGLLRDASESELSLVDLDGETVTVPVNDSSTVTLPHPILMEDLEDWREFAVELGVHQGFDQLLRETYAKPADAAGQRETLNKYKDAEYEKSTVLSGRSRSAGFSVEHEDGYPSGITLKIQEADQETTALLEVSAWDPPKATLGSLSFTRQGHAVPAAEVGPLTWSEAVRMAEFVYSGRTIAEEQ